MSGSLVRVRCTLPGGSPLRDNPDDPVVWLDTDLLDFDAPFDLTPQAPSGARAVDSYLVVHTDDGRPTDFGYTASGNLYATTPRELDTKYFRIKRLLKYADQVWRGDRYLNVKGALIGGTEPLRGQCVVPAAIACRVTDLHWYDEEGVILE